MEVTQIKKLINNVTKEVLGKDDLMAEDLSNVVDVGDEIFSGVAVDNYVKSLVNHIGKVIFVDRPYSGLVPSVLMDGWEFGSVLEKIQADIPEAEENESWNLVNAKSYDTNVFYKPSVSAKFFNKKVTFEIPMSFTEMQVKESFSNANQLNGFLSMLYTAVENSMTIKVDSLVMRTINNMIGETLFAELYDEGESEILYGDTGVKAINLLKLYNVTFTKTLTKSDALGDEDFLKFATYTINLYPDRLSRMSTLFNVGNKERFTPRDKLNVVLLTEFHASVTSYLRANTFNDEMVALPACETIPYWQGSGKTYAFDDTSKIHVKLRDLPVEDSTPITGREVEASGILGIMFDRNALGVTNLDKRVTTNYNAKGEFYNNYYKFDCGYYNDLNENFIVFFIEDEDEDEDDTPSGNE